MNRLSKLALVGVMLALAACSNAIDDGTTLGPGAGVSPGSASDPTSPAFFQEAVGDRVLFLVDRSDLTDEAESILTAQARWLLTNTDYSATIEGHADEQGTREYNLALGARRANAAREFLIAQGVAGSRLKTVSYGKERPIEVCSEESCYAKNRRAVTVLTAATTG